MWRFLKSGKVVVVHIAPPCGTGSAARGIPLPESGSGDQPRALRGVGEEMGLPASRVEGDGGLTPVEVEKLEAANALWLFSIEVCGWCHDRGIPWACENPDSSWFWEVPEWQAVVAKPGVEDHVHHVCMHGGKRKKRSRWRSNVPELAELAVLCDGKHEHLPWKTYTTKWVIFGSADEAEYPWVLCARAADGFAAAMKRLGLWSPAPSGKKRRTQEDVDRAARQVAAGKQPRRLWAQEAVRANIVPEYRDVLEVKLFTAADLEFVEQWKRPLEAPATIAGVELPVGARKASVRRGTSVGGGSGTAAGKGAPLAVVKVGIPWSKADFCAQAQGADHPFDAEARVADNLVLAAFRILTRGPDAVAAHRRAVLARWRRRAEALEEKERALHRAMPPEVAAVLKGKRLLLTKEILDEIGYPDVDLVPDIAAGMPGVGEMPFTGAFPPRDAAPVMDVQLLMSSARGAQQKVLESRPDAPEVVAKVWAKTMEEAERDPPWLRGPQSAEEIEARLGPCWVPVRRFGIQQRQAREEKAEAGTPEALRLLEEASRGESKGEEKAEVKLRLIDDGSEFLQNSTVRRPEKADLDGIDGYLNIVKMLRRAVGPARMVELQLRSGKRLRGALHPKWSLSAARRVRGRITDLESAFKQLAKRRAHAFASVVAARRPEDMSMQFFEALTPLFGETSAFVGFARVSRALREIAISTLWLLVSAYVDDYSQAELETLAASAQATMLGMFEILGWKVSLEPEKNKDFAAVFTLLGFEVNLRKVVEGEVYVGNKVSRSKAILETVREALDRRCLSPAEAASLAGKIQGMQSAYLGACAGPALRALRMRAGSPGGKAALDDHLGLALRWLSEYCVAAKPRRIRLLTSPRPAVIFTDGACEKEGEEVTFGAVILEDAAGPLEYFCLRAPRVVAEAWSGGQRLRQVIGQAEIAPVVIAKKTWAVRLAGRLILHFVDNDAARAGLIKGYSPSLASCKLIAEAALEDVRIQAASWYARVPTQSNVADHPSRFERSLLLALFPGAVEVKATLPGWWHGEALPLS